MADQRGAFACSALRFAFPLARGSAELESVVSRTVSEQRAPPSWFDLVALNLAAPVLRVAPLGAPCRRAVDGYLKKKERKEKSRFGGEVSARKTQQSIRVRTEARARTCRPLAFFGDQTECQSRHMLYGGLPEPRTRPCRR